MGLGIAPKNSIFGYVPEIYELIFITAYFHKISYKFCCEEYRCIFNSVFIEIISDLLDRQSLIKFLIFFGNDINRHILRLFNNLSSHECLIQNHHRPVSLFFRFMAN